MSPSRAGPGPEEGKVGGLAPPPSRATAWLASPAGLCAGGGLPVCCRRDGLQGRVRSGGHGPQRDDQHPRGGQLRAARPSAAASRAARVQVQKLLRMLGFSATAQEVQRLMQQVDSDGSGDVSFDEFCQVMAGLRKPGYSREQLRQAFHLLGDRATPAHHISSDALCTHLVRCGRAAGTAPARPFGRGDPDLAGGAQVLHCRVAPAEAARLVSRLGTGGSAINFHAALDQYM